MLTTRCGWNRTASGTLAAALVVSSCMATGGCASGASGETVVCPSCGQAHAVAKTDNAGETVLKVVATAGVVVLYVFAAACGAAGSGSWSCSSGGSCGSCGH